MLWFGRFGGLHTLIESRSGFADAALVRDLRCRDVGWQKQDRRLGSVCGASETDRFVEHSALLSKSGSLDLGGLALRVKVWLAPRRG